MSTTKLQEFNRWYDEFQGVYNFRHELEEYCRNDTMILCLAIQKYLETCLSTEYPVDPWLFLTAPSMAFNTYTAYYMPEGLMKIHSIGVTKYARQAYHGGKTDVRRMLREFTNQEVLSGQYAKYLDV